MNQTTSSPRITDLSWGQMKIEGGKSYRDAKLFPGGSREWDWQETGTRHSPGIQPADVRELLERGARIIILSRGMNENLRVTEETLQFLEEEGVRYQLLQTEEAVKRYNELREEHPVGGLFHSTC